VVGLFFGILGAIALGLGVFVAYLMYVTPGPNDRLE
jgi:hypothetical protein